MSESDPAAARSRPVQPQGFEQQEEVLKWLAFELRDLTLPEPYQLSAPRWAQRIDAVVAALAAARLAVQQELSVADEALTVQAHMHSVWKERAEAAEAAGTQLRQDLQALPRYQAGEFIIGGRRPHPDGEFVKWRDLADRLAREEKA